MSGKLTPRLESSAFMMMTRAWIPVPRRFGIPAAIAPERSEGTYCAHNGNHREYDGQSDGELEQRLLNPAARTERRLRSTEEARTLSPHLHEDDSYEKDGHHYHSYLEKRLHYPPPMDASFS